MLNQFKYISNQKTTRKGAYKSHKKSNIKHLKWIKKNEESQERSKLLIDY